MNWLHNLFSICAHKWEAVEKYSINRSLDGKQTGIMYVLRCEHCGSIIKRRV